MAKLSFVLLVFSFHPVKNLEIVLDRDYSQDYFLLYQNSYTDVNDTALVHENIQGVSADFGFNSTNGNDDILPSTVGACFRSSNAFSLILLIKSEEYFKLVFQTLIQQTRLWKGKNNRITYCRLYITLPWCSPSTRSIYSLLTDQEEEPIFDINSDFYLVLHCSSNMKVNIMEIYFVKGKLFIQIVDIQQGTFNFSRLHLKMGMKTSRRQDLQGLEVVAAGYFNPEVKDNEYEIKLENCEDPANETIFESGLSVSILRDFKTGLNFTEKDIKISFSDNYFINSFISEEHQFDLTLYHLGVAMNKLEVARPLHSTFFDGILVIFIQPSLHSFRNIYRKPFKVEMWLLILFIWICIFLSCKLCSWLESKLKLHPSHKYFDTEFGSYGDEWGCKQSEEEAKSFDSILWCIAAICQQGLYQTPKSFSIRLILICGLLLSVICYAAYTGMIVSELWDIKHPIKSLSQLLNYTDKIYLITSSDTTSDILEVFSKSDPKLSNKLELKGLNEIFSELNKNPGKTCVLSWMDYLTNVAEELLSKRDTTNQTKNARNIHSRVNEYVCRTFSSFQFQKLSYMYVPKNSELDKLFNFRIIIGLERGLIRRYWNEYKRNTKPPCQTNRRMTPMDSGDVYLAFVVILAGMMISLVILFLEKMYCRMKLHIQFVQLRK